MWPHKPPKKKKKRKRIKYTGPKGPLRTTAFNQSFLSDRQDYFALC